MRGGRSHEIALRLLAFGGVLILGLANAQPFELGRSLSTSFLERLTTPAPDGSEIVVIHAEVGSAMSISRGVARDQVVYLRGSTFLWAQIAEQIAGASARGEPMHLAVQRWVLEIESCPSLSEAVSSFFAQLDDTTSDLRGASATDKEIIVDGATFLIEMAVKDASITITPNGAFDPPLQQAAGELHSVVSRCAGSRAPTVEQHDF
jgi:hypothetical protein